jgi:hypothetical protein
MIKHKIFHKGEIIHCLLSSFNHPNILLPAKGIIKDIKWDLDNPIYLIKVKYFYDSFSFLKEYFFDMNFAITFDRNTKKFPLNREDFKSVKDIEKRLNESDETKFYMVIESVMCVKTKADLKNLFINIQTYLISKKLKELKDLQTRSFYKGTFKLNSGVEFNKRLFKFIGDKFESKSEDFNDFVSLL